MSTGRVRSKTGCLTCKNRRKKCDETRPICERCTKAGMECLGYSYLDDKGDKSKQPKPKPIPRPAKSTSAIAGPSRQSAANPSPAPGVSPHLSAPTPQLGSPPQMLTPPTGGSWRGLAPYFPGDPIHSSAIPNEVLDFSFLSDPTSNLFDTQPASASWWDTGITGLSSAQQPNQPMSLTPSPSSNQHPSASPSRLPQSGDISHIPFHPPSASTTNTRNMTAGQASLFQALFSLGEPNTPSPFSNSASQTPPSSHGSTWPSPDTEEDKGESETSEESDPEGVREIVCRTPTLDRNAPTNSLPFILHSYSKWIQWTVFEPLKMAGKARDWLTTRFNQSADSRQTVTLMANVIRALSKTSSIPTNVLPAISLLRGRAQRNIALVASKEPFVQPESPEALAAIDDIFELISIQFMSSSLTSNLTLIREAAPVYRRACVDPPGAPIDLPAKLIHSEFALRHFPALDILFSFGMCLPMQFRYKIYYAPDLCECVTDIENVGLQWMHGVPDQFLLLLARMNMLRVDFAPHVDPQTVQEIHEEVRLFRPVVGTSSDPFLSVIRMGVQEAWRQTLFIYLYMGLCGADASDSRVEKALKGFIRLLEGTKPGRTPDSFLMLPMIAAGVAARRPQDREVIRRRMSNLRECQQPGTCGFETILTLEELWTRVDMEGRAATWMDLRIAVTVVSGIM